MEGEMEDLIKINGSEFESVSKLLIKNKKQNVSVFCHDNPDIDAIASAYGFSFISRKFKKKAIIYYGGDITHAQNKSFVNVFGIDMVHVEDLDEKQLNEHKERISNSIIVVLDTSMFGFGNCVSVSVFFGDKPPSPNLIIDHHSYEAVDCDVVINKSVGSCSTLIYKLINSLKIKTDSKLKTLLFLGLMKDTDDFKQSDSITSLDVEVHKCLKDKIDFELYFRVVNCQKPRALIGLKGMAYNQYNRQSGNCIVCGVGYVKPSQRSFLAEICDDLMQYDEIERCCCIGIISDGIGSQKYLCASFRNTGDTINTHEFMRGVFGKEKAGGRKGSGGAKIELDDVSCAVIDGISNNKKKLEEYFEVVFFSYSEKILNAIKVQ